MTYCKTIKKHADMKARGYTIGIDGFSLLFLFRENRESFEKYLRGLTNLNHTLTLVMDKRAAKEKKEVVDGRKEVRREAQEQVESFSSFTKSQAFDELDDKQRAVVEKHLSLKKRDAWCLYPEYLQWFMEMLKNLGVVVQWAEQEADEVLAVGKFDIIISSDSDLLIHGVRRLWIPRGTGIQHNEISSEDFQNHIGLKGDRLYELAFLAGCDVQPRILTSIGNAISWLRFYGNLEKIHQRFPEVVGLKELNAFYDLKANVWNKAVTCPQC